MRAMSYLDEPKGRRYIRTVGLVCLVWVAARCGAETVWPGGAVKLVPGRCAKVEARGDVAYVTAVGPGRANVWPAAYFTFPEQRNLSCVEAVKVTITNCSDEVLRVGVKIKAVTEQGQTPDGGTSVQAGKERTYRLPLYLSNWGSN